jgi:hypothetical protein
VKPVYSAQLWSVFLRKNWEGRGRERPETRGRIVKRAGKCMIAELLDNRIAGREAGEKSLI